MSTPASRVRRTSLKSELEHLSPVGLKESLEEGFGELPDPRRRPNRCTHPLLTVIGIGVLTIIAGGKGWEDMELYGQCKRGWLSQVLDLSKGVPSADTLRRVFESLRAAVWEESFRRWVQGLREGAPLDVIAIDGKVLRGSYDREQETPALHLVSAWSEVQFYLSSLSPDSPRLAPAIRAHWGIENSVHWVLDVNFGEDACRVRSLHATRNLALVRRYALNILRCDTTVKGSLRQKSKRAAMDDAYMTTLITQAFPLNSAH